MRVTVWDFALATANTSVSAYAAGTCHPVQPAAIDKEWAYYNSLVSVEPNSGNDKYECIAIQKDNQVVCRTKPANPAHPSIIIRTVVQDEQGISVRTEADTAANCDAFLAMMAEYQNIDAEMREQMRKQTGH